MRYFKRCLSMVTSAALTFTFVVSQAGCSMREFFNGDSSEAPQRTITPESSLDDGKITNEEWLSMVNDAFGIEQTDDMDLVENAKDWGFVDPDAVIDLQAPVDSVFAAKTLVRAGGYADTGASDDEIVKAAVDNGIITSGNDLSDPAEAVDSIYRASDGWKHRTFDYEEDIQYNDNVSDFSEVLSAGQVSVDNDQVTIPSEYADGLQKDSVYILPPDKDEDCGTAMKVVGIKKNPDGTSTIQSVPAELEEVYSKVKVAGGFSPEFEDIVPLEEDAVITQGGIEEMSDSAGNGQIVPLYEKSSYQDVMQLGQKSLPSFTISYPIIEEKSKSGNVTDTNELQVFATFSDIKINTDVDIDFHFLKSPDVYLYFALDYKETVGLKLSEKSEKSMSPSEMMAAMNGAVFEKEIDVARVPVEICPGISIDFVVSFVINANGYISVELSHNHTKGFEVNNSKFRTINETSRGDFSVKISGSLGFYVSFKIELRFNLVKQALVAIDLRVGPKFEGKVTLRKDIACADVSGYLHITLSLKFHKIINKLLNDPKLTITLCDAKNKATCFNMMHLEIRDGKVELVDKCTYGKESETAEPEVTEAPIPTGNLQLEKSYYSVKSGTDMKLTFKRMPADIKSGDLEWASDNTSVVSVDGNGNIKASGSGSATVTVKSKDGKYSARCVIKVSAADGASGVSFIPGTSDRCEVIAA